LPVHRLTKGLDLPLAGSPLQVIEPVDRASAAVAVLGADWIGLKPTLRVEEGQEVRCGELLFEDRAIPGVRHTAPASGRIVAINRGERRAFVSLVIAVEALAKDQPFTHFEGLPPDRLDAGKVRALLLESGMWTALRTRPFSRVPSPETSPEALFVTAMDTRPHAPSVDVVLDGRLADFTTGLACLVKLTTRPTYLCCAEESVAAVDHPGITLARFAGPHPAGNVGTHIHVLHPADLERTVWHIGYQDVLAVGRLFAEGTLDVERVVALAGPGVRRPRLLRTRLGAATDALVAGELEAGEHRVVSGSVLDGRTATGPVTGYLGRFHQQVSVVPEPGERELFGWIRPGGDKFSIWRVVESAFRTPTALRLTTSTNGGKRAMVPIGAFERVMPLDLMPTFLLRALLMGDIERAVELGCVELDEEDLALCTFVCPGKAEYGPLLRRALERIEKDIA
jgi:Na+-transporting NADH:ubiquinone oxidoreductase subunit A